MRRLRDQLNAVLAATTKEDLKAAGYTTVKTLHNVTLLEALLAIYRG